MTPLTRSSRRRVEWERSKAPRRCLYILLYIIGTCATIGANYHLKPKGRPPRLPSPPVAPQHLLRDGPASPSGPSALCQGGRLIPLDPIARQASEWSLELCPRESGGVGSAQYIYPRLSLLQSDHSRVLASWSHANLTRLLVFLRNCDGLGFIASPGDNRLARCPILTKGASVKKAVTRKNICRQEALSQPVRLCVPNLSRPSQRRPLLSIHELRLNRRESDIFTQVIHFWYPL